MHAADACSSLGLLTFPSQPCPLPSAQSTLLCHRLVLQALSSNDAAAALHRAPGVLSQVHAALVHRASHAYQSGGAASAKDLFAAALQYSRPEARPQAARALAACTSALGQHQRAAEWCGIAERGQAQPSSLTLLLRLQALAHTGDAPQVGCSRQKYA